MSLGSLVCHVLAASDIQVFTDMFYDLEQDVSIFSARGKHRSNGMLPSTTGSTNQMKKL